MEKTKIPFVDILFLAGGELVVSLLIIGIYFLIGKYDYTVLTGAILGSTVTVLNYLVLSISVNRACDKYLALRGDGEMTDEEAEKFAAENASIIQRSIKVSYIIRQIVLLAVLVVALLLDVFNVLATVIPLLLFRPILMVKEAIDKKKNG